MKYLSYAFFTAMSCMVFGNQIMVDHNNLLMDHGYGHMMDMAGGMVMGENKDRLPADCEKISEEQHFTVHAGRDYAKKYPGTMFGFDQHQWRVKPCAKVTIEFINEDKVRHQWMLHGLPKYMYNQGMFHLEITGPAKITGSFITPREDKTYLVHCDIAQHMEKGMKGQLIVGKGSANFPSIPGISDPVIADNYTGKPLATNTTNVQEASVVTEAIMLDWGKVLSGTIVGITLTAILLWVSPRYATTNNFKMAFTRLLQIVKSLYIFVLALSQKDSKTT